MHPDPGALERRYRRLLRAYPPGYRRHRGDEMLATMLETARPGQVWPDRRDVAEILRGGLRERLGMHCAPGLVAGVRIAGVVCLAVAVASSVGAFALSPRMYGNAMVAVAWTGAAAAFLIVPRLFGWAVGAAWLGTVGMAANAGLHAGVVRESALRYGLVLACGTIVLLSVLTVHTRPSTVERVGLLAGAVLGSAETLRAAVVTSLIWPTAVRLLPSVLIVAGAILVALRRSSAAFWAGMLLLVPAPLTLAWRSLLDPAPPFLLALNTVEASAPLSPIAFIRAPWLAAAATVAGVVVVAVTVADAHRRTAVPRDGRAALATLSALALGAAGGCCAFLLAAMAHHSTVGTSDLVALGGPVVATLAVPLAPKRLRRWVIGLALAGVLGIGYTALDKATAAEVLVAVTLLLVIAAAEVTVSVRRVAAGAAGALALTAGLTWLNGGELWPDGIGRLQETTIPLVAGAVIVFALWWAPYVMVRAVRVAVGAWLAFAAGLLWLALQLGLAGDTPLLIGGILTCLATVLAARLIVRRWGRRIADA